MKKTELENYLRQPAVEHANVVFDGNNTLITLNPVVIRQSGAALDERAASILCPTDEKTLLIFDLKVNMWRVMPTSKIRIIGTLGKPVNSLSAKTKKPVAKTANQVAEGLDDKTRRSYMGKKSYYLRMLRAGKCKVVFEKMDGSVRTLIGTLCKPILQQLYDVPLDQLADEEKSTKTSLLIVRLFDIEAEDWRSFRVDKVKLFETRL